MGGNTEYLAGYGELSLGQAVHIAQNSDGGVDQRLAQFLEKRLAEVWAKLNAQPTAYILPTDEFALLNYYRPRFGDSVIVRDATKRFWDNHKGVPADHKILEFRTIPLTTALPVFLGSGRRFRWHPGMYDPEQSCGRLLRRQNKELARMEWQKSPQRSAYSGKLLQLLFICLILITVPRVTFALLNTPPQLLYQSPALHGPINTEPSLLECVQVAPPIAIPSATCQQTLMVHTFAFSYGQPFVGEYYPPECEYNRVVFNFTVTSAGRQFDRLALMFFDDIEIFRTSTAEPTRDGIVWSYVKDVSSYLALFKQPQKIIFDLGNLVDDTYTGTWHTTLTATYFTAKDLLEPADIIFPVSARRSSADQPSHFSVPESRAFDTLTIPQNAKKAVFSISACGQAAEEFWWSNVLSSDTQVFGSDNTLYGHSPFRELQLVIDGQLAGVAWPFPVIFTGGVAPGFWRPIVGIDAFDLLEDEIDVTPFLPMLNDNQDHIFEIRVVGIEDDGKGHGELSQSIESSWVVTGKLFIWLDTDASIITGSSPTIHSPKPSINVFSKTTKNVNDTVESIEYFVQVSRLIHVSSTLQTSKGHEKVTWAQNLAYSNSGTLKNNGSNQDVRQNTSGQNTSPRWKYSKTFVYPLWVASTYDTLPSGSLTINAAMRRGKNTEHIGELAFNNGWGTIGPRDSPLRGTRATNLQNGTASYINIPTQKKSYSSGSTEQHYLLSSIDDRPKTTARNDEVLYRRDVLAVNGTIVVDKEASENRETGAIAHSATLERVSGNTLQESVTKSIRALLGRGPR